MRGRRQALACVLAAALVTVVALALPAAAADPPAETVVRFPGVARHFAFDGRRVAWIDQLWKLRTRSLRTGKETKVSYTLQYAESPEASVFPRLVLEHGRLLWLSLRGHFTLTERVYSAPVEAGVGRRLATVERGNNVNGGYVTGIAADALGFSFSIVTVDDLDPAGSTCTCRFQVVAGRISSSLHGTLRRVRGVPPAYLLARAAGRMAIMPVETSEQSQGTPIPTGTVEIRNAETGSLVSSFTPGSRRVRALALSKTTAAVLVGGRIDRYDMTGGLIGTAAVPKGTAAELAIQGETVVFRTSHAIYRLDLATGRISTLASTSPWAPTGLAIDGDTVAWAESRRIAPGEVNQLTYRTRIRTLTLEKAR